MQYLPGTKTICLTYSEFVPKIATAEYFRKLKEREHLTVHKACGEILVEFDSLRDQDKKKVKEQYGNPEMYVKSQQFKEMVKVDEEARRCYAEYILPCGKQIPLEYQLLYARSCDWLNVIVTCLKNKAFLKDKFQITIVQFWDNIAAHIRNDEFPHDLPGSVDRLRRIYNKYVEQGYEGIIDKHWWGNDYARKVTPKIEWLVLSLFAQTNKPYMSEVCKMYKEFITGKREVVDLHPEHGGEVFDRLEFYVSKGKGEPYPYALGESTVDYYLKKPLNEAILNRMRMKALDYNTQYRPSVKRIAPFYSLSKITMDDIDIPFKTPDGDRAVKSYQVFDVASGACIGVAFARDKNVELIREALRDMFRLIIRKGWGIPWEIEFEKHLTSAMSGGVDEDGVAYEDILTPGAVFPATRICLGGNAKEKRAEGFIRVKKYGQQKKRPGFQARFYAKLLTNRLNSDQDKVRYGYEEIVNNELNDIDAHNNELHPRQDMYPGLTRWQVLEGNQNPRLVKYQPETVIQFIGYSTATSIRAGVARVHYGDYALPDIELIKNLHYSGEITAYYLPDDDGLVQSVYLYEDGQFLCEAKKHTGFQEAIVEQTDEDRKIMEKQWGQQKRFDKMIKEGRENLTPVGLLKSGEQVTRQKPKALAQPVREPQDEMPVKIPGSARNRALDDI